MPGTRHRIHRPVGDRGRSQRVGHRRARGQPSTELVAGPMLPPTPADAPLLNIAVVSLRRRRSKAPAEDDEARDAVHLTQTVTMNGDGPRIDFPLPTGTMERVFEIETAPGRLARRGDDYKLTVNKPTEEEQGTGVEMLTFYRPPAGDFKLLLKVDTPTRGYRPRSPRRATIELNAWAAQISEADGLLTPAAAAALAALGDIDRFDLAGYADPGFTLHLLNPRADLSSLERTQIAGDQRLFRSTARLSLPGECELTLTLGAAPAEGSIKKVIPSVAILDSSGWSSATGGPNVRGPATKRQAASHWTCLRH
ncbi:MAG: hypothetical protein J5X21_19700 [Candidatus Accumulibacter sp.]|nr:hypothetical protein [Candidatus Accumulibacter conexus]